MRGRLSIPVLAGFLALAALATLWWALDRRPPEWDHANHLERAVTCARGLRAGDPERILGHSPFYPPLVPCVAGVLFLALPSDVAAGAAVMVGFLGLGMLATWLLGRRLGGPRVGVAAALLYGSAPFVMFSALRFQLDLPLAAMVALALVVIIEADGLGRPGSAAAVGAVVGLGMMVKPPFGLYVAPALLWLLRGVRRPAGALNAALMLGVAAVIAIPWYGSRLLALPTQFASRGASAAETVHQDPWTWSGLLQYFVWLPTQLGVAATVLLVLGVAVVTGRRRWWILASLVGPFLVFEALRNKNLRYTLPLLPLASVVTAIGWTALRPRWRAGATVILLAVGGLQVSATLFDWPHAARVPLLGTPIGVASPPERGDWRQREILALVARDAGGRAATVSVVPNHPFFSVSNFRYYAVRDGRALDFERAWDGEPLGVEYMIIKTGDVGPPWTEEKIRRVMRRLAADRDLARVFPVIGEFTLPDGSVAFVRARHIGPGPETPPGQLAAGLERDGWRRLDEFARDVEGARLTLRYDDALRFGRLARAELSAARATFAEFRRPGAARLRVGDLRLVLEDVLVNPYSAAEGRLAPLDIGALRVERATISAEDFQRFLGDLPRFRVLVTLGDGVLAVTVRQPGPDLSATIRVVPAADRPFDVVTESVRIGAIHVPASLVNWVVRHYDPSGRIARRLPMPATIGRVAISPAAVRIGEE